MGQPAAFGGRIREACSHAYYWATGRSSWLSEAERLDQLYRSPREEIDTHRRRKLLALLSHAFRTVPYYRDVRPQDGLSEETVFSCLKTMPVLTKGIIRSEGRRLLSQQPGTKVHWNTSGGATGEPVRLLQDRWMDRGTTTGKLLYMRWAGHRMGEPHVLIWGLPREAFGRRVSLHERAYRIIHNRTYLNCYRTTDGMLHSWAESINTVRPTLIEAYADAIYDFSRMIIEEGIHIANARAIITGAGVLRPHMRRTIVKAFDCPVLNRYGSREVGDMACSCTENAELHVNEATHYLEIVGDDGAPCAPGVEGNVLVTLLTNYTMPLIRYQIEDRAAWASGSCACGRTTKRLAAVCGRESDFLLAADGTRINGTALTTLLYPVSSLLRRYQFRQSRQDQVEVLLVPVDRAATATLIRKVEVPCQELEEMLKGVSVELAIVDEIIPSGSGKYRYILNEILDYRKPAP